MEHSLVLEDARAAVDTEHGAAPPAAPSSQRPNRRRRPYQAPRLVVWAIGAALALILLVVGEPLGLAGLALALTVAVAACLASSASSGSGFFLTLTAALPAALIVLLAWGLGWGLLSDVLGPAGWANRTDAAGGVAVLLALSGVVAWRRRGLVVFFGRDAMAFAAFVSLTSFFVWIVATQPLALWSRMTSSGTDFLRHLGMIRQVVVAGGIPPFEPAYPRAVHATAAWLVRATGVPTDAQSLWLAAQPLLMLMLALMLLAVVATATRVTDRVVSMGWPGHVAGVVAAGVFLQTAWFSTFPAFGSVMNVVVALGLLSLLLTGATQGIMGSPTGALVCGSVLAITANAWQLVLPVAGLASIPWIVSSFRGRHRLASAVIWASLGIVALNGIASLGGPSAASVQGNTAAPTVSNLFAPDWWWWVAFGLAVVVSGWAMNSGWRAWGLSALGALTGCVATTAFLLRLSGSSWELMLYYPVKAMWTSMVVLVPLGAAGGVALCVAAWRGAGRWSSTAAIPARTPVVLVVWVCLLGVLGRGAAFPPHLVKFAGGEAGMPNWALAMIDSLGDVPIRPNKESGAMVFGLAPSASIGMVRTGFVGMVDYMAMEALAHLGIDGAFEAPVKAGLAQRDMTQVCRYLMDHPDSLRITGPNPAAGPRWIVDSGCPEGVVQPERWISLELDDAWLAHSLWEDPTRWGFPSVAEVRATTGSASR